MARKPMVTRTLTSTKVTLLCMDINTCEPCNMYTVLAREVKDTAKILKLAKEKLETETLKVVHVVNVEYDSAMYGIPEEDFITLAKKLDVEKRQPNAETEEQEQEQE